LDGMVGISYSFFFFFSFISSLSSKYLVRMIPSKYNAAAGKCYCRH
jgi:hypothetical protein